MPVKDHYRTLQLAPGANLQQIKKAFRLLAQQFHPDKNHEDPYASARFAAIKEAYETLTDPVKKNLYLQERWYQQSTGNKAVQELITPEHILAKAIAFERYTSQLDIFRMDTATIFNQFNELLTDEVMSELHRFNNAGINQQIALLLVKPLSLLNRQEATSAGNKLLQLSANDTRVSSGVEATLHKLIRHEKNEKQKWWLILLALAVFVLLIILVNK